MKIFKMVCILVSENEASVRRQSQISLFRVARPTLKNRVKLSPRVGKFVRLFVSKMFSSFENCIIQSGTQQHFELQDLKIYFLFTVEKAVR